MVFCTSFLALSMMDSIVVKAFLLTINHTESFDRGIFSGLLFLISQNFSVAKKFQRKPHDYYKTKWNPLGSGDKHQPPYPLSANHQ